MKIYNNIIGTCAMMVMLLAGSTASAQYMSVPYSMDWEENEAAEIQNWVINPGTQAQACPDQWTVGAATHSAGRRALYISNDAGASAEYTVAKNVQYAYRDLMLPAGRYIFSFDWKVKGSTKSTLSAGFALASQLTAMQAQNASATIPTAIANKCNAALKNRSGQEDWTNTSFQIQSNGTEPTRVFFVWSNSETDSAACGLGACIDNIQITTTACPRPENLNVTTQSCDNVLFTWTGSSADYEAQYRQVGTDIWNTCYDITAMGNKGQANCTSMDEGSYDFRVRGICTPDTSAWSYYTGFVVYCAELHCINFTDLHGPNVTCTYGTTGSNYASSKQMAYASRGVIDFGPDDIRSRHTVNTDPTATDPRTGGALPLIPTGSKFSVRLGNWEVHNGAEAISYAITVDSTMAIILLQYAVVLEDPDGHGDDSPRFLLEVLDSKGNLLDATCGARNFLPQSDWASYREGGGSYGEIIRYKPWTTIGLNLNELGVQDGDQITVRLTTYDCFWSAHYGYAYFTMDCASPTITTKSCAKSVHSDQMELTAPEGFHYQWYDQFHQPIAGETTRTYTPSDTATYYCRLTSTENADCWFELESQCVPRLPIPEFKLYYEPKDCKNIIRIANTSHPRVVLKDRVIEERDEKCAGYYWTYSGSNFPEQTSSRESFQVSVPQDGGSFTFTLTATLSEGCDSTMTKRITIPKIGESIEEMSATMCERGGVWFFDDYIKYEDIHGQDTTLVRGGKSIAGCDSTVSMYVYKAPSYTIKLDTVAVYEGGEYEFAGQTYTIDEDKFLSALLRTVDDCDSMVMQYVRMIPCTPLIYQRWGDVLSVLNEDGQRDKRINPIVPMDASTRFQWYKGEELIQGATSPYYYAPEGLDPTQTYYVEITLATGEVLNVCGHQPEIYIPGMNAPVRKMLQNGRMLILRDEQTYDIYGNKVK